MMEKLFYLKNRRIFKVSGIDRFDFLQGLITQDVFLLKAPPSLSPGLYPALYTALLTPQGRYLHDFFIIAQEDHLLIETDHRIEDLLKRFKLYKLRRHVDFHVLDAYMFIAPEAPKEDIPCVRYDDPRLPGMWQRLITFTPLGKATEDLDDYHNLRIQQGLPDSETDLIIERTFPLEAGLDRLNAISFKKGCYVGQEPVARTHYQGVIRKKLMTVTIKGPMPPYAASIVQGSIAVGDIRSTVEYNRVKRGIAMLRTEVLEKEGPPLLCGEALVTIT